MCTCISFALACMLQNPMHAGFELSHDETRREQQLRFNEQMVQQAAGLLAPTGGARYLTVSTGHTSQFVKAILAGCKTCQESLKDSNGCLNRQSLSKDAQLKKMLDEGWGWLVVSSFAEMAFPSLPSLAEKALNSSNHAFQSQMELEVLLHIWELCKGLQDPDMDSCMGGSSSWPFKKYSSLLAKWVANYSNKGQFLDFLLIFSREYGSQCNLGEEFWAQEQLCWWVSQATVQAGHFGNSLCCTCPQGARWVQQVHSHQ